MDSSLGTVHVTHVLVCQVLVEHFRRRGPGDPCTIAGPEASKSNSRVIVFVQLRNTVTDVVAELATLANEGIFPNVVILKW